MAKFVELFCGLKGWTEPAPARGHDVWATDIDPSFEPDLAIDVLELTPDHLPSGWVGADDLIVLASPPCEGFTVMQISRNWTGPKDSPAHSPKTDKARLALRIVERTLWLIEELQPAYFVIENPRAKLRSLPVMQHLELRTVSYCRYGEHWRKPTDLWGGFPPSLRLHPVCDTDHRPQRIFLDVQGREWVCDRLTGEPCHIRARRGSRTGIQEQRLTAAERAKVPAQLSLAVIEACERDLATGEGWQPKAQGDLFAAAKGVE